MNVGLLLFFSFAHCNLSAKHYPETSGTALEELIVQVETVGEEREAGSKTVVQEGSSGELEKVVEESEAGEFEKVVEESKAGAKTGEIEIAGSKTSIETVVVQAPATYDFLMKTTINDELGEDLAFLEDIINTEDPLIQDLLLLTSFETEEEEEEMADSKLLGMVYKDSLFLTE